MWKISLFQCFSVFFMFYRPYLKAISIKSIKWNALKSRVLSLRMFFITKIKSLLKRYCFEKKETISWKTKMFSTRYRFENCFEFYLNYNHFVWKSLRVKPSRFWEKTNWGRVWTFAASRLTEPTVCRVVQMLFVGVVLWGEVLCVRLNNHPALWESNTRVRKTKKKLEKLDF